MYNSKPLSELTLKENIIKTKEILTGDIIEFFVTKDDLVYIKSMVSNVSDDKIKFCCLNGEDCDKEFDIDDIISIKKMELNVESIRFQKLVIKKIKII